MSSRAPLAVVTDPFLLKHIAAFAHGIPWLLYEFWLEHKPAEESVLAGFRASYPVVEKLAQHGTLLLLDLADQTRFPPTSGARDEELLELNLSSVVRFAVQYRRPEVLDWGLARGLNDRDSPMPRSKTNSKLCTGLGTRECLATRHRGFSRREFQSTRGPQAPLSADR